MKVEIDAVLEQVKAELGNLVFQLAVKEAQIKAMQAELDKKNAAQNDQPADHPEA